jgi:uncharacterized protein DUF2834
VDNRATLYLVLAVIGAIVPTVIFGIFLADHGLDFGELNEQLFENPAAAAITADVSLSSIVFWIWMSTEAPRVGIRTWWPFVIGNLFIGLCFALPLFLYFRERRQDAIPA